MTDKHFRLNFSFRTIESKKEPPEEEIVSRDIFTKVPNQCFCYPISHMYNSREIIIRRRIFFHAWNCEL